MPLIMRRIIPNLRAQEMLQIERLRVGPPTTANTWSRVEPLSGAGLVIYE